MRRALKVVLAATVCATTVVVAAPVRAVTHDVSIVGISAGFDPKTVTLAAGDEVHWTNDDSISHSTVSDFWSSPVLSGGDEFSTTLTAAGTYPYHCGIHTSQMKGTVKVPATVSPSAGDLDTVFVVRIASVRAPDGTSYDVQRRTGSGHWKLWKEDVSKPTVKFDPRSHGDYAFRARVQSGSSSSNWSPAVSVTV